MANWKIVKLETKPLIDGLPEVVVSATWNCSLEQNGKRAEVTGLARFTSPNPMNFTLYSQLTQTQVLGWIWQTILNKARVEQMLQDELDQKISPDPETPPLPWA